MVPAFPDVWTLRRFADGVQLQLTRQLLQLVIVLAHRRASLQPLRLRLRHTWGKIDLYEFGKGCHCWFYCTRRWNPQPQSVCRNASRSSICLSSSTPLNGGIFRRPLTIVLRTCSSVAGSPLGNACLENIPTSGGPCSGSCL